jgi:two-component system sensor histidine kinase KdpD
MTSVAAALAYNFFFLPPVHTFTITDPQSVITVVILLGIATFTSRLTGATRSRAAIGVRNARTNADLAAFAQALTRVSDAESTAETVVAEAAHLLDVQAQLYVLRDGEPVMLAAAPSGSVLTPLDRAALDWAFSRGEPSGNGTATLNGSDWQFHPLKTSLGILAMLGLARGDGADPVPSDRAVLLANLVAQASLAHERLHLESEVRELSVLKERDRLRIALLSSIGHDLRTPMTSVRSAIEALVAEQPGAEPVRVAQAEVQRLERFLGNLLSMVRLESGALTVASEVIDLTDAIGGAVHDLRDPLRGKHIDLKVPASLPFVRADPKLLHQVLINLLANAAEHGRDDGTITVAGERDADGITLTIRDDGAGIDPVLGNRVFDLFVSGAGSDRAGGSGLGLAIVKGFADAMGVTVGAANHPDGGAAFSLKFRDVVTA